MEISNCPLCSTPSTQTKCLLFSVKKKLKQLLNDYVPDFNEQDQKQSKNNHSFIQMLKIIFGDKYFSNVLSNKCNHQKICRYMKRKFKCDTKTFQQLCDHLALKIGQKNFHLQVLGNQVKTLSQSTIRMFFNDETKSKEQLRTYDTLRGRQRQKNQDENLGEFEKKQLQNNGYANQQQNQNQQLNLQYQYFYPFGFYYTPFSSNVDQQWPK